MDANNNNNRGIPQPARGIPQPPRGIPSTVCLLFPSNADGCRHAICWTTEFPRYSGSAKALRRHLLTGVSKPLAGITKPVPQPMRARRRSASVRADNDYYYRWMDIYFAASPATRAGMSAMGAPWLTGEPIAAEPSHLPPDVLACQASVRREREFETPEDKEWRETTEKVACYMWAKSLCDDVLAERMAGFFEPTTREEVAIAEEYQKRFLCGEDSDASAEY